MLLMRQKIANYNFMQFWAICILVLINSYLTRYHLSFTCEERPLSSYNRPGITRPLVFRPQQRMAWRPAATIYLTALRGMHEIYKRGGRGPGLRSTDICQSHHRTGQIPGRILQVLDLYHCPESSPDEITGPARPRC